MQNMIARIRALLPILSAFIVAAALFPIAASAQVSNYVDLSSDVSAAAGSVVTNLPIYIVLGLGIWVGVVLFRVGIRWLGKFVRS